MKRPAYVIYLIPGLGLKSSVFEKLKINNSELRPLEWKSPLNGESLKSYASRFIEDIEQEDRPKIIIGHSFGGVLAQEIANQYQVDKIVLISTVVSGDEIPFKLKSLKYLSFSSLLNKRLTLLTFPLWANIEGYKSPRMKEIFTTSVSSLSNDYMPWAINALANWKGITHNSMVYRIHGSKDRMFALSNMQSIDCVVNEGTHLMVHNKGEEVSELVRKWLAEIR